MGGRVGDDPYPHGPAPSETCDGRGVGDVVVNAEELDPFMRDEATQNSEEENFSCDVVWARSGLGTAVAVWGGLSGR